MTQKSLISEGNKLKFCKYFLLISSKYLLGAAIVRTRPEHPKPYPRRRLSKPLYLYILFNYYNILRLFPKQN
jgi:hypothetical protein